MGRATSKRRRGYQPRARNALYQLAAEFKRNQPKATAEEAWQHFIEIARSGGSDVLLEFDGTAGVLTYAPDPERFEARMVKRRSFEQQYYRLGNIST